MLLTIYDKQGNKVAEISPDTSSTQQKEVEGDNVLTLSFKHYRKMELDVNAYTDFMGERYWLTERYQPKQLSEQSWQYDLKLYGVESLVKRFLVLETTDGNAEPVFTLTAPPREHVQMIVKCINTGMGSTDWKVGTVDGTDNVTIDYEGKYCSDALSELAEAVGGKTEWWVEGQTVNLCRCEQGDTLTLAYGKGLTSLERDTSNTNQFYTRLFPIGSTRNIDPETYGHSRLMLPGGQQYIETHTDEYGIFDLAEQEAFSDIYPRRTGTVSEVRSKTAKDDDGEEYTIYYFKDSSLDFDPNDYELAGEVKRVSFQDGELAGLGTDDDHYFEVNYDSKTGEFEMITIWPYSDDTQLPGGALIPKAGDHYILWNIKMPQEYITAAEEELLEAANQYNTDNWQDIAIYKGQTDHVWVERLMSAEKTEENPFYVGRRIRLESSHYFPEEGYKDSRITKLTRKVTLPTQVDLEISDALQEGSMQQIGDSISDVRTYVRQQTSGILPDIIRTGDATRITDQNLLSALRTVKEILARSLSRQTADTASGLITFLQGLALGQSSTLGISPDGVATLLELLSPDFSETGQQGYALRRMEGGRYEMYLTNLMVWGKATFNELEIRRLSYAGGNIVLSAAGSKIVDVTPIYSDTSDSSDTSDTSDASDKTLIGWKCHLLADDGSTSTQNTWKERDQARCQTYNVTDASGSAANRYYWRLVSEVSAENEEITDSEGNVLYDGMKFAWVVLSAVNYDSAVSNDAPQAGDTIVQMGNQNSEETSRQGLIILSSSDRSITVYNGIMGYYLETDSKGLNHVTFSTSPGKFRVASQSIEYVSYNGDVYYQTIYRGQWQQGTKYDNNDEVDWNGTRWVCTDPNGEGIDEEPTEDSQFWRATTPILRYAMGIEVNGSRDTIDYGETVHVVCKVYFGDDEVDTTSGWQWSAERDSGDSAADTAWALRSKVTGYKGEIDLSLTHDSSTSDVAEGATYGTVFTFRCKKVGSTTATSATLAV